MHPFLVYIICLIIPIALAALGFVIAPNSITGYIGLGLGSLLSMLVYYQWGQRAIDDWNTAQN